MKPKDTGKKEGPRFLTKNRINQTGRCINWIWPTADNAHSGAYSCEEIKSIFAIYTNLLTVEQLWIICSKNSYSSFNWLLTSSVISIFKRRQ